MVLSAILCLSACSATDQDVPDSSTPPEPTPVNYSILWSATPGVDLQARPAELIRAAIGGAEMTQWYGSLKSFPGYAAAITGSETRLLEPWAWQIVPTDLRKAVTTWVYSYHLLDVKASVEEITGTTCGFRQSVVRANPPSSPPSSTYVAPKNFRSAFHQTAYRITMTKPADQPAGASGTRDEDPAEETSKSPRVPTWNVYGSWKIHDIEILSPDSPDRNPVGCTDWWKQRFPSIVPDGTGDFTAPPEGFETKLPQPQPATFPEWISPGKTAA